MIKVRFGMMLTLKGGIQGDGMRRNKTTNLIFSMKLERKYQCKE
jgi:hypothetical protein